MKDKIFGVLQRVGRSFMLCPLFIATTFIPYFPLIFISFIDLLFHSLND